MNPTVGPFGVLRGQYLVVRHDGEGEMASVTDADVKLLLGATR